MINNHLLKCSKKRQFCLHDRNIQCPTTEIYKISNGLSPPLVSNIFTQKIVALTICDLIFSFPGLLYPILVQLFGALFLMVPKTHLILVFLKNRIKRWKPGNFPYRLYKTFISRVGFTQASAPVTWTKFSYVSLSCLYKRGLAFKFLTLMFIIMFITFQFLIQAVDVNQHVYIVTLCKAIFNVLTFLNLMFVNF